MIRVHIFNAHPTYNVNSRETAALVRRVCKGEDRMEAECSVIFINDTFMKEMNGRFLDHWYATDVLSFSSDEHRSAPAGEVYVNLDQARRQAKQYKVTIKNEVTRLIVHGLLHLIGYNDSTKYQKQMMTKKEDSYI